MGRQMCSVITGVEDAPGTSGDLILDTMGVSGRKDRKVTRRSIRIKKGDGTNCIEFGDELRAGGAGYVEWTPMSNSLQKYGTKGEVHSIRLKVVN